MSDRVGFKDFWSKQTKQKCEIEFNDHLREYTSFDKIRNIYKDIMDEVKPKKISESEGTLIYLTWPNYRGGNYNWEMFKKNDSLIMFEYCGEYKGYSHGHGVEPEPKIQDGKGHYRHGKITIIPPDKEMVINSVKDKLRQYYKAWDGFEVPINYQFNTR